MSQILLKSNYKLVAAYVSRSGWWIFAWLGGFSEVEIEEAMTMIVAQGAIDFGSKKCFRFLSLSISSLEAVSVII